jgi:adenine/guanine/hypoxanthine permease
MINGQIRVTGWLERWFHLKERRTDLLTECRAGIATFMVMAYIIFVNPSILGSVADSRGEYLQVPAVLTVTCLTAGLLSLLMGLPQTILSPWRQGWV